MKPKSPNHSAKPSASRRAEPSSAALPSPSVAICAPQTRGPQLPPTSSHAHTCLARTAFSLGELRPRASSAAPFTIHVGPAMQHPSSQRTPHVNVGPDVGHFLLFALSALTCGHFIGFFLQRHRFPSVGFSNQYQFFIHQINAL
ncbi:hypothetical protein TIFTF001_030890 [Ficus carica]|uniref:Uncharacterized protein n=1 Tax=Ficus carica TaxID=3494 RepID=A0AA88DUL2_FICCA|nr:hypothetical protein TIFTF001_030890 [Ficus carica]